MAKVLLGHVKGDQGEQGIPGIQGIQGIQGNKGDPGPTAVNKDGEVQTEINLKTERTATPTTMAVQCQDIDGNVFYMETSPQNIYMTDSDGGEVTLDQFIANLVDMIGNIAFFDSSYDFASMDAILKFKKEV